MDLLIRPVRLDDAQAIVGILNPIIEAGVYTVLDTPLTAEFERDYIASFPARGVFLVAEAQPGGDLVGLQSIEPYATYTHAFDHVAVVGTYVSLAHRRQGIGHQLSEEMFHRAKRAGYKKIFTTVRADNHDALNFYRAMGFRIVGIAQRHARIGQRYVHEVIIERHLQRDLLRYAPLGCLRTLETGEEMVAYLDAAPEDGDPALAMAVLGYIARAKGMSQVAREAGLGSESLYKSLSPTGNPEFSTVLRVMQALGLRLHVQVANT